MACYGHEDTERWTKWEEKCSECGKYHKLNKVYTFWFNTMDGGDSISTYVCWKCTIIDYIYHVIIKLKAPFKKRRKDKETIQLLKDFCEKHNYTKKQTKEVIKNYKEYGI